MASSNPILSAKSAGDKGDSSSTVDCRDPLHLWFDTVSDMMLVSTSVVPPKAYRGQRQENQCCT